MDGGRRDLPLSMYVGIFLLSFSAIVFEFSLMRFFSISYWHHFAFLIISIALFGYGASGTFLAIFRVLVEGRIRGFMAISAALFSLSSAFGFLFANELFFDPFLIHDFSQFLKIGVEYVVFGIPFFFAGACTGLAVSSFPKNANRIYFADLGGAAFGSVSALFLMGSGKCLFFASIFGAISCLAFSIGRRRMVVVALAVIIFVIAFFLTQFEIKSSPYKDLNRVLSMKDTRIDETVWLSYSKVDIVEGSAIRHAPGLSASFNGTLPPQIGLTMDNDALRAFQKTESTDFVEFMPSYLPYAIRERRSVLLIQPDGHELAAAMRSNASVVVVEKNGAVARFINRSIGVNSKVVVYEGGVRNFLAGNEEKFDAIVLPMQESTAMLSAGIYGLSEEYEFTSEAFEEYFSHLADDGVLVSHAFLIIPPKASLRILSTASKVMEKNGINSSECTVSIRTLTTITFLFKKVPFTREEIERLREFSASRKFDLVYYPNMKAEEADAYSKFPEPYFYMLTSGIIENRTSVENEYLFDIRAVSDDRPFFSNFFRLEKASELHASMGKKWEPFFEGGFITFVVFMQALLLSAFFILLPLVKLGVSLEVVSHTRNLLYFALISLGFMLIEVSLVEKFILLHGNPVHAFSATIFPLLLSAGIGSYITRKISPHSLVVILPFLSVFCVLYSLFLGFFVAHMLGADMIQRYILGSLIVAPIGFLMGMPFPLGIKSIGTQKTIVAWAWGVSGCASVLSSTLAMLLAMHFGFSFNLLIAGLAYLIAFFIAPFIHRFFSKPLPS
ncbi:MAG: hypothetical protein QXP42_05005 [Candidatus Micrarchaeia archaeon]